MKISEDDFWQSQRTTPLIEALDTLANRPNAAFYAPGHKRGQGIAQSLVNLMGLQVFRADLPELPELGNLFAPDEALEQAQILAAEAFGADRTWFLVNGSTCGVIAAIMATCRTGDKIILPRNLHQSCITGLILSGAIPIFINPDYNPQWDLAYSITPEALEATLNQHSDAKAVLIVYPTYHGICGDIQAIAEITHRYQIPLLVDEAHGPHFHFHEALPPSALSVDADLTIQSTHKVLGAMTQASMLHLKGDRLNPQRICQALQLLQSTSPSYLLLASLDGARQQMALAGETLLSETIRLANLASNQINQIEGLSVFDLSKNHSGCQSLDPTRLTVNVTALGISGLEADEILHTKLGVTAELPLLSHLAFIISIGNTQRDIQQLIQGFKQLAALNSSSPHTITSSPLHLLTPSPLYLSPRDAYFSEKEMIPFLKSIGRISGELICPYPPGIPVLMPGEIISAEAIEYLRKIQQLGGMITGCTDPTLTHVSVINC